MNLILKPADFLPENASQTLIKILGTFNDGKGIFCTRAVPPEFSEFAEKKGVVLDVRSPIVGGEAQPAQWQIIPTITGSWDIEALDEVRDVVNVSPIRFIVKHVGQGIALLEYRDRDNVEYETWALLADLKLLQRPEGGFRNAGEI